MIHCGACYRTVAREDRVEHAGEVYHRQCAPDDYAVPREPSEDSDD
jgi:hypothetical protein